MIYHNIILTIYKKPGNFFVLSTETKPGSTPGSRCLNASVLTTKLGEYTLYNMNILKIKYTTYYN